MVAIPSSFRSVTYAPIAVAGPFPVDFPLFDGTGADLEVRLNGEIVAGWTFSGTLESGFYGAPNTWVNGSLMFSGPITGVIVIKGKRAPRRPDQFQEGRGVPARDHNAAYNELTAVDQELRRDIDRAVLVPDGELGIILPPLSERLGKWAGWDAMFGRFEPREPGSVALVTPGTSTIVDAMVAGNAAIQNTKFRRPTFPTLALFFVAQVPASVKIASIDGFVTEGDVRSFEVIRLDVAPTPIEPWHHQSGDGAWWRLKASHYVDPAWFGARLDGGGDNAAAFTAAGRFCALFNVPMRWAGTLKIDTPVVFTAKFDVHGLGPSQTALVYSGTSGNGVWFNVEQGPEWKDIALFGSSAAVSGAILKIAANFGTIGCVGAKVHRCRFVYGSIQLDVSACAEADISRNEFFGPGSVCIVYGNERNQYLGRSRITHNRFVGKWVWSPGAQIPTDGTTGVRHISGSNFWLESNHFELLQAAYSVVPNITTPGMFLPSNLFIRGNNIQYANTGIFFAKPLGVGFPTYANVIITSNIIVARYCILDNLTGALNEWVTNAIINDNAIFPTHENCIGIALSLNCATISGNQFDAADPNNGHLPFPGSLGINVKPNSFKVMTTGNAWSVIANRTYNPAEHAQNVMDDIVQFGFELDLSSIPAGGKTFVVYNSSHGIQNVRVGDFVIASMASGLLDLIMTAQVSGTNEIRVDFFNPSGSAIDLGAVKLRMRVLASH